MAVKMVPRHFQIVMWSIPATVLIIIPGWVDPINYPKMFVLFVIAISSIVLFLSLRNYSRLTEEIPKSSRMSLIYPVVAVAMILAGVLGSENFVRVLFGAPGRNNGLVYYLSVILIAFLILRTRVGVNELAYFQKTLSYTSIIFGFYCGLQALNVDPIKWNNPFNRVIGTLGNPNFSSAALSTFAVFWLFLAAQQKSKSITIRLSQLGIFGTLSIVAWTTQALQGLLILVVGSAMIGYLAVIKRFTWKFAPALIQITGGLSLVFLFVSFIGLGPLGAQLEQYTLKLRATYASIGFKAMLNFPLTGIGVDNYNAAFRLYRTPEFIEKYGIGLNADNAHSTPAQIGATFGLIVFLLYVALHIYILKQALSVLNSKDKSYEPLRIVAILWILIFAQSLLSIEIIGLGVMNWILGALLLSAINDVKQKAQNEDGKTASKAKVRQLPAWVGAVSIITPLIAALPFIPLSREDSAYKNIFALQMQNESDKEWVKEQYTKLTEVTLSEPSKVARLLENMYNAGMTNEIRSVILNAYKVNKKDVYANEMLATYYHNNNLFEKEQRVREDLREIDPVNYQLELNLARLYSNQKKIDDLRVSVARIIELAPNSEEAKAAKQILEQSTQNK